MRLLTTREQNIATRCKILLAEDARPHALFHYSLDDIDGWLLANVARVQQSYIGIHVLFKPPYVNGDAAVGVPPVDGRLEWQEPERVRACVDIVHAIGGKILHYVAPKVLRDAGMDSTAIVEEVWRHHREYGFDGVYLDGAEAGDNIEETLTVYQRLRGRGLLLFAHDSVQPHVARNELVYGHGNTEAGKVEWEMPTVGEWTHRLWGETNQVPSDAADFLPWLRRRAGVETIPGCLCYYKLGPGAPAGVADTIPQARLDALFAWRTYPGKFNFFWKWLPKYVDARTEYQRDRDAFVRRVAREW